jgi:hypothetical protein
MGAFEPLPPPRDIHKACRICEQHYLTEEPQRANTSRKYHRIDDQEAQLLLLPLLQQPRDELRHVKDVLDSSHGDVILSRWKKLSHAKRAKLLNTAAPDMFLSPSCEPVDFITPLDPEIEVCHAAIPGRDTNGFAHDFMKLL